MATIEDVARRAGVARSTVSYALSGKRSISRETRERIEAAITELGFTPNAGARALATSQTMVIGLFVQFFEDEFSPAMLQYVLPISDAAREAGYDILMVTEADGPHAVQRIASSGMVDGVMLLNVAYEDTRLPVHAEDAPAGRHGRPAARPGRVRRLRPRLPRVGPDPRRPPGRARPPGDHPDHAARRRLRTRRRLRVAVQGRRARAGGELRHPGQVLLRGDHAARHQPAAQRDSRREAGDRDDRAQRCRDRRAAVRPVLAGHQVPDDLSVVGVFSEDFGRLFSLPYTAVETSPNKLGRLAVQALVQRMLSPEVATATRVELVPPHITDRGSTR